MGGEAYYLGVDSKIQDCTGYMPGMFQRGECTWKSKFSFFPRKVGMHLGWKIGGENMAQEVGLFLPEKSAI